MESLTHASTLQRPPGLDIGPVLRQHEPTPRERDPMNTESLEFETAVRELETLVEQLERGDSSLEQSLAQFERGVQLARHCQKTLQEAEQRVLVLIQPSAEAPLVPFEPDSSGG